ncbi:MAG: acetoacetate--CoA ligase, partial [Ramlibacter sp.]
GRLKEVINRGGEKVFPYEVEKAMLEHPAVVEAAAFGVPHPRLGENVVAAAVLKPGADASAHDIRSLAAERLAAFKVPARIEIVRQLPRGDTGKVSRRLLAETYATATQGTVEPVELFQFELLAIWRRLLGTTDIGIDDDFADKGGDSLLATDMLLEVEQLTGRAYPSDELSRLTIRHISDVVASGLEAGHQTLTQVRPGTGPALFFCHGDHVTRGIYAHRLAAFLPQDQPVYLLGCAPAQLEDASIEDIAAAYLREVLEVARGAPVFVGGYCNGGLAAWHLAHLLRMHGVQVLGLLLVETPSLGARESMRRLATAVHAAGATLPGRTGRRLAQEFMGYAWRIARKGWRESARLALARCAGIVPGWRGPMRAHAAAALPGPSRATTLSLRIMASYVPARLDVPVTCFIADGGVHEHTEVARWRHRADEVRELRTPGTHHTAVVTHRAELGAAMSSILRPGTIACPEPAPVSQMAAFAAELAGRTGRAFDGYDALHAFSVAEFRTFWRFLFDWCAGPLGFSGAPEPVCVGDEVEHARFFPSLQLNYADALLNLAVAPADAPALRECHAGGTGRCWTRGELRDQVARLAVSLRAAGVRPGDHVVAVMRNDARAVVAALAVTGLGATLSSASPDMGVQALLDRFEPLEPRMLLCHLAAQPTDVGPPLATRVAGLAARLPALATVVSLDGGPFTGDARLAVRTFDELLGRGDAGSFDWPRFPFNHPLFIMFSSGTTGRPKCIVHGAGGTLLEHVKEHRLHTDLRPGDRMYFHTSCGWMMWNWQLSALASGVEIVTYDGPVDPVDRLWTLASREAVTVFGTSPAYLKMSQEAGLEPARMGLDRLRAVLSTGAVLHDAQFDWVERHVKPVPLQSISGGTDIIGCFVLGHPDLPVRRGEAQCRSLGLDVQAWLDGRPTTGVGDLVCARPFPSRPLGFHGDSDGTRFHKTYFSQNPGVWTHGDLIEFSAAGGARLHGRSDGVLNVRGIKVSPAEIYRVLDGIPGIREAMVVQQESREQGASQRSGAQVVALLVLQEGTALGHELAVRIRRELAERLSAAHVPDRIIDVPALPVTHSGKPSEAAARAAASDRDAVNAGALRNPDCLEAIRRHPGLREVAAPRDLAGGPARPLVEQLCSIWERVLGTGPVTPDMNFFELGGSSLLAVMMLHKVRELSGRSLPLAALIQAPTPARLAAVLEQAPETLHQPVVRLRDGAGLPVFLVHGLSGTVMECWRLLAALQTPRPVWGLQARGIDGEDEPLRSVEDLAQSYVEHVLAMQHAGPYWICGFSFGGLVAYEMARQLTRAGHEVKLACLLDTYIDARLDVPALAVLRIAQVARTLVQTPVPQLPHFLAAKLRGAREDLRWRRERGRWRSASEKLGLQQAQQRVYDAMEAALAKYRPGRYDGPVLLVRAQPPLDRYFGSLRQWRQAAAGLSVVRVPGTHLDLVGRHAGTVAAHLDAALRPATVTAADPPFRTLGPEAPAGGSSNSTPATTWRVIHHSTGHTSCPNSRN